MGGCMDVDCKKGLQDLQRFTYGENPGEGIMGKINEVDDKAEARMPKSWVWTFLSVFGVVILASIVLSYYKVEVAYKDSQEARAISLKNSEAITAFKEESSRMIAALKENDSVMLVQYRNIAESLGDIKRTLEKREAR